MKKIIKYQNEFMLAVAALVLLVILLLISGWELGFLADNISKAINSGSGGSASTNFDLNGAKQLNLKGLVQ